MVRRPNALVAIEGGKSKQRQPKDEEDYHEGAGLAGDPPEIVRSAVGQAGKVAARKLLTTLQSPEFDKMSSKEQLRWINAALDRAYGPSSTRRGGATGKVQLNHSEQQGLADTLSRLSGKVKLPEMGRKEDE